MDDAEGRVNRTKLWVVHVLIIRDEFAIVVILLFSIPNSDITNTGQSEFCRGLEGALRCIKEKEVLHDEGIRSGAFPVWVVDVMDFLLFLLAPFDASIATETAEENPVDER